MGFVFVSGDHLKAQRALAGRLALRLGYRLISPEAVIEAALDSGVTHGTLLHLFAGAPRLFDRFLQRTQRDLLVLRAILARELQCGGAICYGAAVDLVLHEDLPVTRVQTIVPSASETLAGQARRRWLRLLYGRADGGVAPDIVIDLDRTSLEDACRLIAAAMPKRSESAIFDRIRIENFALASNIRAALAADPATARLELHVISTGGHVSIQGEFRNAAEPRAVTRVAREINGVIEIRLNGEEYRPEPAAGDRISFPLRPILIGAGFLTGIVLFSAGLGKLADWRAASEATLVGVITDSRCGAHHSADAVDCIRTCVAHGGWYALSDGTNLYKLSDQHAAAAYAARRVRVRGVLAKRAGYLQVASLDPLP